MASSLNPSKNRNNINNDKNVPVTTSILIKLTNGDSLRQQFDVNNTLMDVVNFIAQHRTDGEIGYLMRTTYPSRSFASNHMHLTLKQLQLAPSGTLILTPVSSAPRNHNQQLVEGRRSSGSHTQTNANSNRGSGVFDAISNFFSSLFNSN